MTQVTQVYVLIANNGSDFGESDIVVAATSREAAERQLAVVIAERWKNALDEDDREFYGNLESYADVWRPDFTVCGLAS